MNGFFSAEVVQTKRPSAAMIPRCGACQLFKHCETPKMPPRGRAARKVLIVGNAPSESDDRQGYAFAGESGTYLRGILAGLDVDLERDAVYTNALICRTQNGSPDAKQISHCRPNLLSTIAEYDPDVIIPMGHPAVTSVLQDDWLDSIGTMERWTGWQIPLAKYWVCPTNHPAVIRAMNNTLLERQFATQLQAAFALEGKPPFRRNYAEEVEILYDDYDVWRALKQMDDEGGWIAFDYETNCLKPEYPKAQIWSCAVSNGRRTISYPWIGRSKEATVCLLASSRTRKIAANAKFEERWTRIHLGTSVKNFDHCTVLAAHCLDNRQSITSLKFQAFVKLGIPTYNQHIAPLLGSEGDSHYNQIHKIEPRSLLMYGGMDGLSEFDLAMLQRKELGYED